MNLTKQDLARMFSGAAMLMAQNTDKLSEIDSRFGDGDHGVTIAKICKVIDAALPKIESTSLKDWFDDLSMAIMGVSGGSAGPLYGTMLGGFGVALTADTTEVDPALLKDMFAGCLSEMQGISTAKIGDKTMMDALIPAVNAADAAPDDICAILFAAAEAAEAGAKKSEEFISKFGRARSYKEQTIGTPDAGAVSTSLFFRGLATGFAE